MLQGMTAHYLCNSTYRLRPGDTALVHAAAGAWAVARADCQNTAARASSALSRRGKGPVAPRLVRRVILYTQTDFEAEVKRLTGARA